ncbi:hypothetical protein [Vreelandella maris]|mgnify:CR=1 FL=1|uniref:hypothetical protein n=1 Tax=Vreelandella maris TaxID=2729617 RepID=UPI0030EE3C60
MKIIRPTPVTEGRLTGSDVPIDDYPVWTAGEYNEGDSVVVGIEAFEALETTSDEPVAGASKTPPSWLRLGYVNKWRMFRDGRDSKTRQDGGIATTVTPGQVANGLALLGLEGLSVTVTMTDPVEGIVYQRTEQITDISVNNWYDWYFLPYGFREDFVFTDMPPYSGAEISVVVNTSNPADTAAVGRYVIGMVRDLGLTLYGTSVRTQDFSVRERDGFGNLTIVRRRQIRLVDYRVDVETPLVDSVKRELDQIANEETVFIGADHLGSTIIFGFYRDFDITISNYALSAATLEVEGY